MQLGADISRQRRYMTCARPVRAFGVASRAARKTDDRHGTFERRTGCAPAQTLVPLLASRHAGNGLDHGPLRRRHRHAIDARRARRIRAADGGAGPRALGLDHRRSRCAAGLRHRAVPSAARVQPTGRGCKMSVARNPAELLVPGRPLTLAGVADGAEGLVIADLARVLAARADAPATTAVVVCRDGPRMAALARALDFFAPDLVVQAFPAWDCLPYDRVSPHAGFVAQRMTTLSRLARVQGRDRPSLLLTTVNAALQRVPTRDFVVRQSLSVAPGNMLAMDGITQWLELNGFVRASTVREPGDYAVRGGIIDLYAPGMAEPVRLDFFGDTLETIRSFDPESQRTTDQLRALDLVPVAEFQPTTETIRRFRLGYVATFGAPVPDDLLYHAVSEGRRHGGMEHWLPLFHDGLETLFDYLPGTPVVLEPLAEDAARERLVQIKDYYDARQQVLAQRDHDTGPPYRPLPPDRLYLGEAEWRERLDAVALARLTPFALPEGQGPVIDIGAKQGRNFAAERAEPGRNVFEAVARHVTALQGNGKRAVIALWS